VQLWIRRPAVQPGIVFCSKGESASPGRYTSRRLVCHHAEVAGGRKYPFNPFYGEFRPRLAVAWNPSFSDGVLGALFGPGKTVIRGGYSRIYGRLNRRTGGRQPGAGEPAWSRWFSASARARPINAWGVNGVTPGDGVPHRHGWSGGSLAGGDQTLLSRMFQEWVATRQRADGPAWTSTSGRTDPMNSI